MKQCKKNLTLWGLAGLLSAISISPKELLSQTLASKHEGAPPLAQPAQKMVPLKAALAFLGEAYQVNFLYKERLVKDKVGLKLLSVSNNFSDDLDLVLGDQPLTYARVGANTIVILPREPTANPLAGGTITGKTIAARTQEPLIAANVYLKGTKIGAVSNETGSYKITGVPPGAHTVVASFIGYRTESANVTISGEEQATADFTLKEDAFLVEEVVVTGIASSTAKEIAEVAVARVSAADLTNNNNYTTLSQLITGKVAGVTLVPTSGNIGGGFRFNVRSGGGLNGDEQPIIYVDGVRVNGDELTGFTVGGQGISLLSSLNPEDIEKVEFLKGPAGAASYGTSGANGVVLISTKRGKLPSGQSGVAIDYKVITGRNEQAFKYSPADYLSAKNANRTFRTGDLTQHSLSATGGIPAFRYYTSFDRRREDGHQRNNSADRTSLRANFDVVANSRLNFQINSSYASNELQRPNNDDNLGGYLANTLLFATPYRFADSAAVENISDKTNSNRFIGALNAEYTPYRNLVARISFGIDNDNIRQDQTFPVNLPYPGIADLGSRQILNFRNLQYTYNFNGRYSYNLTSSLKGSTVAGVQLFNRRQTANFFSKFDFPSELIKNIGAGTGLLAADEAFQHRREAGLFAETSLSYRDQYYLTLGLRRDYASVVGTRAPSINYPKGSLALRMDRYASVPAMFDLLKLRAAYGETGVLPGLLDGIDLLYRAQSSGYGRGAVLSTIGNSQIQPERVKELELGFETVLFTNYAIDFTYYLQKIRDSIVGFVNSPSTGKIATAAPFNIGEVEGSGVEVQIQASPLRQRNFGLDLSLIGNYQTNEVTDLGGAQPIVSGITANVIREGLSKHQFFTRKLKGPLFDPATKVYLGPEMTIDNVDAGSPIPKYNGSLTVNFRFLKNFNLYALADWATEFKVLNLTNYLAYRFGNNPEYNGLANQLNLAGNFGLAGVAFFSPIDTTIARLTPGTSEYQQAATRFAALDPNYVGNFIEDGDFLKLREISLNYSFKAFLPKAFAGNYVKDFVIGFSARNVWTTTKYSGPDPEVNAGGGRSLVRGSDFLTLQSPRTYNLTFKFSLNFLTTGLQGRFATAHKFVMVTASGLSDELFFDSFVPGATFPTLREIDLGAIRFDNFSIGQAYNNLGELRFLADDLVRCANAINVSNAALKNRALYNGYLYGGIARYFYAAYIGLNPTEGGGVIDNGPFIPSEQMYALAVEKLQMALTLAGSPAETKAINSLIARIHLFRGNFAQARTFAQNGLAAADAPLQSRHNIEAANEYWLNAGLNRSQYVCAPRFLDYVTADPQEAGRLALAPIPGFNGMTYQRQAKYADAATPIDLINWQENALMLAELDLRLGNDAASALPRVNAVRASHGIGPLAAIDLDGIYVERDKELFVTGVRLVDQRRFNRFHLPAGTWQFLPITDAERNNNPNLKK